MELIFLRHGNAEMVASSPQGSGDFHRSLTEEGRQDMIDESRGMKVLGLKFDAVLSSPLLRARQTAELAAQSQNPPLEPQILDALSPGVHLRDLVHQLRSNYPNDSTLLLVGHEPDMSDLTMSLSFGKPLRNFSMKKGAMACVKIVDWNQSPPGQFKWLLTPKLLIAAGRALPE